MSIQLLIPILFVYAIGWLVCTRVMAAVFAQNDDTSTWSAITACLLMAFVVSSGWPVFLGYFIMKKGIAERHDAHDFARKYLGVK